MKQPLCYSFFFLLILFSSCKNHQKTTAYAPPAQQQPAPAPAPKPTGPAPVGKVTPKPDDMQVTISEDLLNKCFKALGPISGKEPYEVLFVKDTFTWILVNPQIHLHPGRADFTTDVAVVAGPFAYTTNCVGDVSIWYDRPKNIINVKITKCIVEIYTKVFGKKVHIKDLDIADQFTDPFTFEGPAATSTDMDMEMPDGSIRKLYMTTTDCDLTVKEKEIVVPCEVAFSLTPPPPAPAPKK